MCSEKIDFVILWVDGSDPKWLAQKNKYLNLPGDSGKNRFRECNNLQYFFRGVEKYANWVNNIFFVTWGHIPKWLDINNPRIKVIKHSEFIPKEYLPTFNSNVIELNLHRIKDLSEQFVLFNDDLFILDKVDKKDFFVSNLPKDVYVEYVKKKCSKRHEIIRNNYLEIINKHFNKKEVTKRYIFKYFNIRYGFNNFKTIMNLKNKKYSDFLAYHLTQPFLKSVFQEVWDKEYLLLDKSCYNRFRANTDIGRGVFRYWQLLSGKFVPTVSLGKYFILKDDNSNLIDTIRKRKNKIICINDADVNINFEKAIGEVNDAFETIFPEKSSFEK